MRIVRATTLLTSMALAVACSGDSSISVDGSPLAPSGAGVVAPVAAPSDVLAALVLGPAETERVGRAFELLAQQCMLAGGFTYFTSAETNDVGDPNAGLLKSLSAEAQTQWTTAFFGRDGGNGGCRAESLSALYGSTDGIVIGDQAEGLVRGALRRAGVKSTADPLAADVVDSMLGDDEGAVLRSAAAARSRALAMARRLVSDENLLAEPVDSVVP